ncbi:MAG TPA: hypothetical protein ENI23_15980 [bacterium]|nr:hypothetical protein [bacterium]
MGNRMFGPKQKDHPSVNDLCQGCGKPFKVGDYTTLITIGPGDDPEEQQKAREGRPYNAVAIEVHFDCAGE